MAVLGIDTSNYRTSMALVDDNQALLADVRRLLVVQPGQRGLRQGEALFQHINNLPLLAEQIAGFCCAPVSAVCVSARPRPQQDSYMPVFLAGQSHARTLGALLRVPVLSSSHQEGHLRAALYGLQGGDPGQDFLAVHLSGGTTEMLRVHREAGRMDVELLGGTLDLNAGQLIDRVGVKMGLAFPAGEALEALAQGQTAGDMDPIPAIVRGVNCHFSGAEAEALRRLDAGAPHPGLAMQVLDVIARTLVKWISAAARQTGLTHCLVTGGVAANARIAAFVMRRLPRGIQAHFAPARFCGDNAVGIALLGLEQHINQL